MSLEMVFLRRNWSRVGPFLPMGSSGGMNLCAEIGRFSLRHTWDFVVIWLIVPITDKGVHEDPLLDDLLILWLLVDQVPVVVVAHHDGVEFRS